VMEPILLANVVSHSAQVALVVGVGGLLPWLFRVEAPSFRYFYWRALLALCLLLPFLQGWHVPPALGSMPASISNATVIAGGADVVSTGPITSTPWLFIALAVLAWGMLARGAWVAISLLRLRRLRSAGRTAPLGGELDDLQRALGTRAEIRFVAGLRQPVTFGIRWPVVLLPDSLLEHPDQIQRVVLCHELLHVQRNDWGWAFGEELVRVLFWFHPAVWWAVSRVQLAREEVVDEQVVRITGARRTYIEALMAFAEASPVAPAAAFSRRRHLFRRILLISRRTVVSSSRRQLLSGAAMAVVLIAGSRYAVEAFPLLRAPVVSEPRNEPGNIDQPPPAVAARPMAHRFMDAGAPPPPPPPPQPPPGSRLAPSGATVPPRLVDTPRIGLEGVDEMTRRLQQRAAGTPGSPLQAEVAVQIARDRSDDPTQRTPPDRDAPSAAPSASREASLIPEAASRGLDRQASFSSTVSDPANAQPIRVGGNVSQPAKIRDVKPVYPPIAAAANVSGIVILEVTVGSDGKVVDARVLRSIPLLDQAALDAVRQWEFVPTLLNGAPTPIVMSVTVNFTLG
jgi:protein TonB